MILLVLALLMMYEAVRRSTIFVWTAAHSLIHRRQSSPVHHFFPTGLRGQVDAVARRDGSTSSDLSF